MDVKEVKDYAIKVLISSTPKEDVEQKIYTFESFFNNQLIDTNRLLKGCINHYYDKKYKENKMNSFNTVIDCAIKFGVSTSTVNNTIYKFKKVRLLF